jgi:hypothetical protein
MCATYSDEATLSKVFFSLGDCKYAVLWADQSVAQSDKEGANPDDVLSSIMSQCHGREFMPVSSEEGSY